MDANEVELLTERLKHTLDLLKARLDALEQRLARQDEVASLRLSALERSGADHEARLRAASETLARLATTGSLAQVLQAGLAVILSAIAAWLGSR